MKSLKSILILFFICCFHQSANSQITNGTIKIRKTDQQIIGKTLSLFDLRTRECGTIYFEDDEYCQVNFIYKGDELKNLRVFLDNNKSNKKFDCSYSLISDSSFVITWDDYRDTCFYNYVNENQNIVKFHNTPQGTMDNNQFAFFFGFDSVVYSQSYLSSLSDLAFTDSILVIDSIYNSIIDDEKKAQLTEELKTKVDEYKSAISYNYFVGRYQVKGKKINLLNSNNQPFGALFFQKKDGFYNLFTHSKFDVSYPVVSQYTHRVYGRVILKYDSAIVEYHNFNRDIPDGTYQQYAISKDTFLVNQPLASNLYFYKELDTLYLKHSVMSETVKFKDIIGGYYPAYLQSLNGNKLVQHSLFFTGKKAVSTSSPAVKDTFATWKYSIQDGVFFLYNEKDTLIDEMKNGFESFRFTYRNNQPYVFGAYQRRIKRTKENEFILLFANNKGVKLTCSKNEYKYARESIKTSGLIEKEGINYEYFKYSATDEFIWLEYQNGTLEEMKFFNYNKALRIGKGKNLKNYYLVN